MDCRPGCGACCIAISISSPIPPKDDGTMGMPDGKPAGIRCPHLNEEYLCDLFGKPQRPEICKSFAASPDFCGSNQMEAFSLIKRIEEETAP